MTLLPIVERELRVGARRPSTHVVRVVVALAAMLIGMFLFVSSPLAKPQVLAGRIFLGLSILALVYCLYSGRRSTADCLSQEKREGTLGLLFLTDLKGYDVVLGKLTGTSVNGLYCLLAFFPVLALPLLLGGISQGEFWRMVLVLLDSFFLSLAVGIFASVVSRDARRAMGLNLLLLLVIAGGPAAIAASVAYFGPARGLGDGWYFSCPVYPFYLCEDLRYRFRPEQFWCSLGVIHGLTWLLVAAASWRLPRAWGEQSSNAILADWRARWREWLYGKTDARNALRKKLLDVNAYYWLASRVRVKAAGMWIFLAFALAWWVFVRYSINPYGLIDTFTLATAMVLNGVIKVWVGIETGQRLAEDHNSGALELLLSTPLSAGGILRGQFLALRRQFLKPVMVVIIAEIVLVIVLARRPGVDEEMFAAIGLVGIVLFVADTVAVAWVAMSSALTSKSPNQAAVWTVWRVLMLPWVVYGAVVLLASTGAVLAATREYGWQFYLHLWLWLGLAADLGYGVPAWWQVRNQFRLLALRRVLGGPRQS